MTWFRPLSTEDQTRFYDELSAGKTKRGLWGLEKRFSPEVALHSPSFKKYFLPHLSEALGPDTRLLDVGCGTGMYFPLVAPLCGTITGLEVSEGTAKLASETIEEHGLSNAEVAVQDSTAMQFTDDSFDAALAVDCLHHVYDLDATLAEIHRVVKPAARS
jgi:ubiquinone/menaquinone biosynthesis C-methylase UbiE